MCALVKNHFSYTTIRFPAGAHTLCQELVRGPSFRALARFVRWTIVTQVKGSRAEQTDDDPTAVSLDTSGGNIWLSAQDTIPCVNSIWAPNPPPPLTDHNLKLPRRITLFWWEICQSIPITISKCTRASGPSQLPIIFGQDRSIEATYHQTCRGVPLAPRQKDLGPAYKWNNQFLGLIKRAKAWDGGQMRRPIWR